MNVLYYHSICPKSRFVRILMSELGIETEIKVEEYWKYRETFLKLNPAGDLPVLLVKDPEDGKTKVISGIYATTEYIFSYAENNFLIDDDIFKLAEIRKLIEWCAVKFNNEVTLPIVNEKIICFYRKDNSPNSQLIRHAKNNLSYHLDYMTYLLSNNDWVAGSKISAADIFFASQISLLDYVGEIAWPHYGIIKNWYMIVKSRPSFRNILNEKIIGFVPSGSYELLDF